MNEPSVDDPHPLLKRVNALLQRHQQPLRAPDDDVPVLTEVVAAARRDAPEEAAGDSALNPATVEELVAALRREVLEQLEPKIEHLFIERMVPILSTAINRALSEARADLTGEIRQIVHDAVASAVAQALEAGTHRESS